MLASFVVVCIPSTLNCIAHASVPHVFLQQARRSFTRTKCQGKHLWKDAWVTPHWHL